MTEVVGQEPNIESRRTALGFETGNFAHEYSDFRRIRDALPEIDTYMRDVVDSGDVVHANAIYYTARVEDLSQAIAQAYLEFNLSRKRSGTEANLLKRRLEGYQERLTYWKKLRGDYLATLGKDELTHYAEMEEQFHALIFETTGELFEEDQREAELNPPNSVAKRAVWAGANRISQETVRRFLREEAPTPEILFYPEDGSPPATAESAKVVLPDLAEYYQELIETDNKPLATLILNRFRIRQLEKLERAEREIAEDLGADGYNHKVKQDALHRIPLIRIEILRLQEEMTGVLSSIKLSDRAFTLKEHQKKVDELISSAGPALRLSNEHIPNNTRLFDFILKLNEDLASQLGIKADFSWRMPVKDEFIEDRLKARKIIGLDAGREETSIEELAEALPEISAYFAKLVEEGNMLGARAILSKAYQNWAEQEIGVGEMEYDYLLSISEDFFNRLILRRQRRITQDMHATAQAFLPLWELRYKLKKADTAFTYLLSDENYEAFNSACIRLSSFAHKAEILLFENYEQIPSTNPHRAKLNKEIARLAKHMLAPMLREAGANLDIIEVIRTEKY